MSTATAVQRECDWLSVGNDALPALLKADAGPFDLIDAYEQAAATRTQARGIYVTRSRPENIRVANQRIRPRYTMRLLLRWPVKVVTPGTSTSIAAAEQQAFDDAIELVRQRVAGPLGDKSHGGRFLSAGEASRGQAGIFVEYEPAGQSISDGKGLRASMTYQVDDYEFSG